VHRLTGRPISAWQAATRAPDDGHFLRFALVPGDRAGLRLRLAARFDAMLEAGFVAEVAALQRRPDLHARLPALRSVGYRQLWAHCAGETSLASARELAITATWQLAKRQMTWLRSQSGLKTLDPADAGSRDRVITAWRTA
jgi:tRNA dimethylallyltransferase